MDQKCPEAIEGLTTSPTTALPALHTDDGKTAWSRLRPWEFGWERARQVRDAIGISSHVPFDIESALAVTTRPNQGRGFQAFGSRDSDTGPSVVLSRHSRDTARRFVLARAMWHIVWGESHDFLVTSAYTDKQKMERAFAAELLAPAAGVAALVGDYPSADDLDEIGEAADHFLVSPMIIEHQIQNQLADTW